MNDIDYEDFYNQAHLEQLKLLKESGLDSVSDDEPEKFEIIFWNLAKKYVEKQISPMVFSILCSSIEGWPNFHNISLEARNVVTSGILLNYSTYIKHDQDKINELNLNIEKLVDLYFNIFYLNFGNTNS